ELPERLDQLRSEHLPQERAARLAVAVLAGKRAAVAHHQVGGAFHKLSVLSDTVLRHQIEADAHVNAAVSKMPVESAIVLIFVHQLANVAQVASELFWSHGRIVPSFPLERG